MFIFNNIYMYIDNVFEVINLNI